MFWLWLLLGLIAFAAFQVFAQFRKSALARKLATREENTVTIKTRSWSRGLQIHRRSQ